ncbi:MAG: NUDIX hydrolase [Patescibacteria group bacterium]
MSAIREFGMKRENEERRDGGCAVVFDPTTQTFAVGKKTKGGCYLLFGGGVDKEEDIQEGTLREVVEESGLYDFLHVEKIDTVLTHYYNSLKKVNRVALATCFLFILKSSDRKETCLEDHERFSLTWVTAEDIISNWNAHNIHGDVDHWLYFFDMSLKRMTLLGYI